MIDFLTKQYAVGLACLVIGLLAYSGIAAAVTAVGIVMIVDVYVTDFCVSRPPSGTTAASAKINVGPGLSRPRPSTHKE